MKILFMLQKNAFGTKQVKRVAVIIEKMMKANGTSQISMRLKHVGIIKFIKIEYTNQMLRVYLYIAPYNLSYLYNIF